MFPRASIAKRVLGVSSEHKTQCALERVNACTETMKVCIDHMRTLPGVAIGELKYDDTKAIEEWAKNSDEWNKQIASDTSISDLIMLTRIHCAVARNPSILSKKLLIHKPLILIMDLQSICQQWPIRSIDPRKIEELRLACYSLITLHNQKEIISFMIAPVESKSNNELEKEEEQFRVSAIAADFVSRVSRTFMTLDLSLMVLSRYPVCDLKVHSSYQTGFTNWVKKEVLLQPSETLLQSFRSTYYNMILPIGGELWYQRNPITGEKKGPESVYYTEVPDKDDLSKATRRKINEMGLDEIYKSEDNRQIRNAMVYALYDYMFSTYLNRKWGQLFTVLEMDLRNKLSMVEETHTFGHKRLPLVIQIGPSFYVHHNGRCNYVAGSEYKSVEDAIVLWVSIVTTEYDSKLSYGEDASSWFRSFM
jgi:hypothetical protein